MDLPPPPPAPVQHDFVINMTPPPLPPPVPFPLPPAQHPFDKDNIQVHNLGPMNVICPDCLMETDQEGDADGGRGSLKERVPEKGTKLTE
jgi:hypothetical protein